MFIHRTVNFQMLGTKVAIWPGLTKTFRKCNVFKVISINQ